MNTTDKFKLAAAVTPLVLLATAGIVIGITSRQDARDVRMVRERGEIPPR